MIRTLALVAVRQQQHDVGELAPLRFTGGDELVDDGLRAVDEVAELSFPEHERIGVAHGVAVLEADGRELAERGVVDHELAGLRAADVV